MFITVKFEPQVKFRGKGHPSGHWLVDPSPAIVTVGTQVRWLVIGHGIEDRRLRWSIQFRKPSPFSDQKGRFEIVSRSLGDLFPPDRYFAFLKDIGIGEEFQPGDQIGVSEPGRTDSPGDFKYDLRVQSADGGSPLGEDDPWLHVVRPTFVSTSVIIP